MGDFEHGSISVLTRGHYVVRVPEGPGPHPLLLGFHGYAQHAQEHLEELLRIPGHERWLICAAQGLHLFYRRRSPVVGASWMTRLGRDEAIVDNIAYVARLLATLRQRYPIAGPLVFAGFSQGVAMAYRASVHCGSRVDGTLLLAGDVPPELTAPELSTLGRVVLGRGKADPLYGGAAMERDLERLREAGVTVDPVVFDGSHEWSTDFLDAAGSLLRQLLEREPTSSPMAGELAPPSPQEDLLPLEGIDVPEEVV